MSDFVLSCCSTADEKKEFFDETGIKYACFHYSIDGKQYIDDLWQSKTAKEFFKEMTDGAMPITSQVNVDEFTEFFENILKEGKDIIHVCLSSGISGTYNSANIAANELREKYPDRKLTIIDSLAAASGFGMFMKYLNDLKNEGKSYEEICDWAEENKLKVHHWVVPTDLTALRRGGRLTATAAFFGGLLNICPVIKINAEGKLDPVKKIRTKRKAIEEVVNLMLETADNGSNYDGKCEISHSVCLEDANALKEAIEEKFPNLKNKVVINDIGAVIGAHTGPGTFVLFYMGEKRN